MTSHSQYIASLIKEEIEQFSIQMTKVDTGTVFEVSDGIARINGLQAARYNELLHFSDDTMGIALNLEEDSVAAAILGSYTSLKEGDEVQCTGRIAEIPVGDDLLGRVVDPLGRPLDGKEEPDSTRVRPIERIAPNVATRQSVDTPVQTGLKVIDGLIPIGRGQRQLIIGDRSTGKTAITIDTIINQNNSDMICIYVAIGQKASKVARVISTLEKYGAMDHTIIVAANASDSVALQYLAPYAGCAIGEEIMESGKHCLIVYDDLTKHAWAYRQLSLLLRRPPGREAYPGDVFYLHSRLLERSARLSDELGGGTLTALPIIETLEGDMSAYIPTNIISITDGQIFLETDLFNSGQRPAVNAGRSVSRVGSTAQTRAIRRVAGRLRLELAQYRELASFAQFGTSELDQSTRDQLERGKRITEVMKQNQFKPMPLEKQVLIMFAAVNGFLDNVAIDQISRFEADFHEFIDSNHPEILSILTSEKDISPAIEDSIRTALTEFKKGRISLL